MMTTFPDLIWQPNSRVTRRFTFQLLQQQDVEEDATPFLGLLHFNFDTYLIILSVKQFSFFESFV